MSSKGGGTALTRRNYRLASDTDKPKATGIVNEKLLSDYLHQVFPSTKQGPVLASLRKPLGFQDVGAHLESLLSEGEAAEDGTDRPVEGRLGPQPVVLDHTSGFEGLLFVDDDLLGVRSPPRPMRSEGSSSMLGVKRPSGPPVGVIQMIQIACKTHLHKRTLVYPSLRLNVAEYVKTILYISIYK